jgi:hypothetical protein
VNNVRKFEPPKPAVNVERQNYGVEYAEEFRRKENDAMFQVTENFPFPKISDIIYLFIYLFIYFNRIS